MAYVVAVCGSGGKTTLVKSLAEKYAKENKKVCITTTTHMWYDNDAKSSFIVGASTASPQCGVVCYVANIDFKKQLLTPLNDDDYKSICERFDYVIIEADGSRSMPMKIPKKECEPVIPQNVNEIIIVVGMEAIGREIAAVCHRFDEFYEKDEYLTSHDIKPITLVTEELLDDFVKHYYYDPLKNKYSDAKVTIYKNAFDMSLESLRDENTKRVAMVLLASGFSKRFGDNKLLVDYNGKKLYEVMIDKMIASREIILEKLKSKKIDNVAINVAVVSQYDTILNDSNYKNRVIMIANNNADNGQSESIKLAVNKFNDYDAIVFVNADMPLLPENELASFVYLSMLNKTGIASMYSNKAKNPAYFEKEYFDEILKISGDVGPKELLDKHIMKLYKYYISEKYLADIDTREDLSGILGLV